VIAQLSQHFAYDSISLDELEQRIERAYHATSVEALRTLTSDLPATAAEAQARRPAVPEVYVPERERILSVMSGTKRRGVWRPARTVEVLSIMSDTRLDLRDAVLAAGVTEINVMAFMTGVRITVPPGVRVVVQAQAMMGNVIDETYDPPRVGSGAPVIRITGTVFMSELKVRIRSRSDDVT